MRASGNEKHKLISSNAERKSHSSIIYLDKNSSQNEITISNLTLHEIETVADMKHHSLLKSIIQFTPLIYYEVYSEERRDKTFFLSNNSQRIYILKRIANDLRDTILVATYNRQS